MSLNFYPTFKFKNWQNPFVLIVDSKVKKNFPSIISKIQNNSKHLGTIVVISGEKLKTPKSLLNTMSKLDTLKCQKDTTLIAMGGGTVLDFVGLVANLWMRGICWHAYPTTILAQVDSCLGGKTAINFKNRKNLIGTIYPPTEIFICHEFVKNLPQHLQNEGSSEIFKHALLTNDTNLLKMLKSNLTQAMIKKSLLIKQKFIQNDLHEKNGLRVKLNLGHTFGHALEQLFPQKFTHGAAIWWGLKIELLLSQQLGAKNLNSWLELINANLQKRKTFQTELKTITRNLKLLFSNMALDKKNCGNKPLTFIALNSPGKSYICHHVPKNAMTALKRALEVHHD